MCLSGAVSVCPSDVRAQLPPWPPWPPPPPSSSAPFAAVSGVDQLLAQRETKNSKPLARSAEGEGRTNEDEFEADVSVLDEDDRSPTGTIFHRLNPLETTRGAVQL